MMPVGGKVITFFVYVYVHMRETEKERLNRCVCEGRSTSYKKMEIIQHYSTHRGDYLA